MHSLSNKQLVLFVIVIIGIGLLLVLFRVWPSATTHTSVNPTSPSGIRVPPPQPAPSTSDTIAAQSADTFQLVISYVNSGFEPATSTVQVGDTVRFTNNSTGQLWVASAPPASGEQYPGNSLCGTSALDSCGALPLGQFWEFTFTQPGTWEVVNNFDKSETASITVQ